MPKSEGTNNMWQMQNESVFKLMLIASNFDGGYTEEAVEQANLRLTYSNGNKEIDLKAKWELETKRLIEKDRRCSICGNRSVEYSQDIYFCTEEVRDIDEEGEIELPDFIPEIYSESRIGTEYTHKKAGFMYIKGTFKVCHDCLVSPKYQKNGELEIGGKLIEHPMYKYYAALGFDRIKNSLK
jgi:hypothetical protein